MNQIQTSMDWSAVEERLLDMARTVPSAEDDLIKIIGNMRFLIKRLSHEEIVCRQKKRQTRHHSDLVAHINQAILHYEQLVTLAALSQPLDY